MTDLTNPDDTSGHPHGRRRLRRKNDVRFVVVVAVCLIGLFTVLAVVSVAVFNNVQKINATEKSDLADTRAAAFRLCERGNLTRAEIHATISDALGQKALIVRQQRLPLNDCWPNFTGKTARRLSDEEQDAYRLFYVAHNGLPPKIVKGHITDVPLKPEQYQIDPDKDGGSVLP